MREAKKSKVAVKGWFSALTRLVIMGGFFTALTFALLPPVITHPTATLADVPTDQVFNELSRARSEAGSNSITKISWTLINAAIGKRIEGSTLEGLQLIPIRLGGCHVTPVNENSCDLVMERRFYDHPIYSRVQVSVVSSSEGYRLDVGPGAIGRLPLPGSVVLALTPAMKQLIEPFASELEILRAAKSIEISSESLAVGF